MTQGTAPPATAPSGLHVAHKCTPMKLGSAGRPLLLGAVAGGGLQAGQDARAARRDLLVQRAAARLRPLEIPLGELAALRSRPGLRDQLLADRLVGAQTSQ